jgi:hypothetical protein
MAWGKMIASRTITTIMVGIILVRKGASGIFSLLLLAVSLVQAATGGRLTIFIGSGESTPFNEPGDPDEPSVHE